MVFVVVIVLVILRPFSVAAAKGGLFPSIAERLPGKAGRNLHKGKDKKVQNRARATTNGRTVCCKARHAAADLASAAYIVLLMTIYTAVALVLVVRRIFL